MKNKRLNVIIILYRLPLGSRVQPIISVSGKLGFVHFQRQPEPLFDRQPKGKPSPVNDIRRPMRVGLQMILRQCNCSRDLFRCPRLPRGGRRLPSSPEGSGDGAEGKNKKPQFYEHEKRKAKRRRRHFELKRRREPERKELVHCWAVGPLAKDEDPPS